VKPVTAPARSFPLGLIIALNVVLMLAIALVLFFVLRPSPHQPPAVSPASTPPAASSAAPAPAASAPR
jgi:hypothetical protein